MADRGAHVVKNSFAAWVTERSGVLHTDVRRNEQRLSWAESVELWQSSEDFRDLTLEVLRQVPFQAFFWETPPFTGESATKRLFEFVVIDAARLARTRADSSDFGLEANGKITVFPNLGKDALLVVPTEDPNAKTEAYGHIANFVRKAPVQQQHALLTTLGSTLATESQTGGFYGTKRPIWVNTEGSGVPWLHVRLDSRPKYYHHSAFRTDDPARATL